ARRESWASARPALKRLSSGPHVGISTMDTPGHTLKIVVTFAVASEFRRWRRSGFMRVPNAGTRIYRMRTAEAEVWVVMTGIGTRQSHRELRDLLAAPADLCIASGFAGSLSTHPVGSIVVARS